MLSPDLHPLRWVPLCDKAHKLTVNANIVDPEASDKVVGLLQDHELEREDVNEGVEDDGDDRGHHSSCWGRERERDFWTFVQVRHANMLQSLFSLAPNQYC